MSRMQFRLLAILVSMTVFAGCKQEPPATTKTPPIITDEATKDTKEGGDAESSPGEASTTPPTEPEAGKIVALSISDLPRITEFGRRKTLSELHQDERLEVTGFVYDVGAARLGTFGDIQPFVILCALQEGKNDLTIDTIDPTTFTYCFTPGTQPWKQIGPGAKATLRGKYNKDGALEKCEIVKAEGEPVPAMTATQLAQAYSDDPDGTNKKYGNLSKRLIVTGKIKAIAGSGVEARPVMTGVDKLDVQVSHAFHDQFMDIKPGDEITVIAHPIFIGKDAEIPISLGDSQRIDLAK